MVIDNDTLLNCTSHLLHLHLDALLLIILEAENEVLLPA
jgi:hypothetical protein